MIEFYLRPRIEGFLFQPLIDILKRCRITPNQVTLFSLICGVAVIPFLYFDSPLGALAMLWLSGLGDVCDGGLARESEQTTDLGTIYDIVSDRIVEFSVILAFYLVDPTRSLLTLMMLGSVLSCVTTFLVVGIVVEKRGPKSFYYSPGLMERAEAFIMFSLMILFPAWFSILGWLFVGLVILTAALHIISVKKV